MRTQLTSGAILLLLGHFAVDLGAADRTERGLEQRFAGTVRPFLDTYCLACHGKEKQKGKLDLSIYSTVEAVALDYRRWEIVLEKLKEKTMPPEEAKHFPPPELRRAAIDWIQALRRHEARRNAGDPGSVPARRLSNAEYNHTIRDLTGVDIRPAQEFPVDPANEAGFDNSGESLAMSSALLTKYLEAARRVAEHIVLKPQGFVFAPHPTITETDRDKFCVQRIIDFYQRQPTDYADYFMAAWRFQHRAVLRQPKATLAECAAADKISSKYLATIWSSLVDGQAEAGPMASLRTMWRELPAPRGDQRDLARGGCEGMRDFILGLRQKLRPEIENLTVRGIAPGSQPLVLWKDRQYAANRQRYDLAAWRVQGHSRALGASTPGATPDPAVAAPADKTARAREEAALDLFCRVFPDAFYVSERVLVFLKEDKESRGRLLSAGFHLMTGYFRDDALASRLSYFLWSSMPDAELLARAKAEDLHRPKVLLTQTRRMLQDDRIRGLVTEFGGNWVVRRLLGEQVPPPPPKVPELPGDEGKLGELTVRELLARHREDKSCAGCHDRFDAIGLVFEGYGPVGEQRLADLGGRKVDTRAIFPGWSEGTGLDGLRRYLHEHREKEFLDNSCVMFISNMWSGSKHDSSKVPVLLAGGLGGALETGRVLGYAARGDDHRKLCSLYLSIMDRMSVKLDRFGDAETRLAGL